MAYSGWNNKQANQGYTGWGVNVPLNEADIEAEKIKQEEEKRKEEERQRQLEEQRRMLDEQASQDVSPHIEEKAPLKDFFSKVFSKGKELIDSGKVADFISGRTEEDKARFQEASDKMDVLREQFRSGAISEEEFKNQAQPLLSEKTKGAVKTQVGMIMGFIGSGAKNVNYAENAAETFKSLIPEKETVKEGADLMTQFYDRLAPISKLTKGKVQGAEDPYVLARNYAGRFGKIQNRLDDLGNILKQDKEIIPQAKEYALIERYQELLDRGIEKLPENISYQELIKRKASIEKSVGEEGMQRINKIITGIREYSDGLLTEAKDAGIISEDAFIAIKNNNHKYLPLQRLDYLHDQLDNLPKGGEVFSVASQDIIHSIEGGTQKIADPLESLVRNTYNTVSLIERNKVAQAMADLADKKAFEGVVSELEKSVPKGMDKFSVLRNGVKEEYIAPKEVVDALKGMNKESVDLVSKIASKGTAALRAGATTLNTAFILPNAIRDYQTATLVSKVGFNPLDWVKGFAEAIKKGDDYKSFLESGASFSGMYQKDASKTIKEITKGTGRKVAETVLNPLELTRKIGEVIELAPRIGVYKKSLAKGLDTTEAAFNAREATVDFAKSGNTTRLLNMWVPFLNARVQGTVNAIKAFRDRPVASSLKTSAMIGLPTIATYINNVQNYPDIWNEIAQTEKDNNFIVIYGNEKDKDGNPQQVFKIPKGDVGRVFGNPLENFLEYMNHKDSKSIARLGAEILSDVSPVSFMRDGGVDPYVALSGVLPPTIKAGVETLTNKNLYTGRDIVPYSLQKASPELQYKDSTSPVAKFIGEQTGTSPLLIENAVGTQFGGLGKQLLNPLNPDTGVVGAVSGRFSGARGGNEEQQTIKELEKLHQKQTDERVLRQRKAEDLLEKVKMLPNKEDKQAFIKETIKNDENPKLLYEKFIDTVKDDQQGLTYSERLIKGLGVENGERADYLYQRMQQFETEDQKREYVSQMWDKGIATKEVLEQLANLAKKEK